MTAHIGSAYALRRKVILLYWAWPNTRTQPITESSLDWFTGHQQSASASSLCSLKKLDQNSPQLLLLSSRSLVGLWQSSSTTSCVAFSWMV